MITILLAIFGILGILFLAAIKILAAAASDVLADEFKSSAPLAAAQIVRRASRRLPPPHQADYLETWLAELEQYEDRPVRALCFAVYNCALAARRLGRELAPALAPAPGSTASRPKQGAIGGAERAMRRSVGLAQRKDRSGLDPIGHIVEASMTVFLSPLSAMFRLLPLAGLDGILHFYQALVDARFKPPSPRVRQQSAVRLERVIRHGVTEGFQFVMGNRYDYSRPWKSVAQLFINLLIVIPLAVLVVLSAIGLGAELLSAVGLL